MARTTSNTIRRRSDSLAGDDVHYHQQSRYAAVINPTDDSVQAWGYGRRAVFVPNELDDPKRACIQFIDSRIARKMVYNQRRLLEVLSFDQGRRLLRRSKELGDFGAAYAELTGRELSKAAQEIRRRKTMQRLRRQLDQIGIQVKRAWDIETMQRILKDPQIAFDVDAGPASVQADDDIDAFIHKERRTVAKRNPGSVGEAGLPGDFIQPEALADDDAPPERVMSEALLREEHGDDPFQQKIQEQRAKSQVKPLSEVQSKLLGRQAKTDEAARLREEIKVLGGSIHPRTRDLKKLRAVVAEMKGEDAPVG
jgi:hypothetical protein